MTLVHDHVPGGCHDRQQRERELSTAAIKGNLVPDAFLAALAIGSGSEWISTDRDYHRFPGLRVGHPLE